MVGKHRRLGYCKEKSIQMIKSAMLLMLFSGLTYRVVVHSIMNRSLIPTLLLNKDLLSASPGHRRGHCRQALDHGHCRQALDQTNTLLSYASIELGGSMQCVSNTSERFTV